MWAKQDFWCDVFFKKFNRSPAHGHFRRRCARWPAGGRSLRDWNAQRRGNARRARSAHPLPGRDHAKVLNYQLTTLREFYYKMWNAFDELGRDLAKGMALGVSWGKAEPKSPRHDSLDLQPPTESRSTSVVVDQQPYGKGRSLL
jgi:hypothetical protein